MGQGPILATQDALWETGSQEVVRPAGLCLSVTGALANVAPYPAATKSFAKGIIPRNRCPGLPGIWPDVRQHTDRKRDTTVGWVRPHLGHAPRSMEGCDQGVI
jgi:hypothetical protein